MHLRSILALALLVGLLGYFLYQRDPNIGAPPTAVPLFPGVETGDLRAFRIDHAARGYQLKLERDEAGRWAVTDPLNYPAHTGNLGLLFGVVKLSAGFPEPVDDLAAVGLDPPRALFEVTYEQDGELARRTIELGALDTDSSRVWVRVDGVTQLTLSNIDDALQLGVDAYRSRTVAEFDPGRVLEFERTGLRPPLPGEPELALDFHGLRVDGAMAWRATRPAETWLAGESIGTFLGALRAVSVAEFHDDSFDGLEAYGLDDPAVRIELTLIGGERMEFRLTPDPKDPHPDAGLIDLSWLCVRTGYPFVWRVKGEPLRILAAPAGSFYDYALARGSRELFDRFEVGRARETLVATREGEQWSVASGPGLGELGPGELGPGELGPAVPGDPARILDALLRVQSTALLEPLPEVPFDGGPEWRTYRFSIGDGLEWAGRVGAQHRTPRGLAGRLVQREGDGLVYLGPEELWEALGVARAELVDKTAVRVSELELAALEITGEGGARRWLRDDRGRWELEGDPGREARELWSVLDRLLGLEVERWIGADAPGDSGDSGDSGGAEAGQPAPRLLEPVEVRISETGGTGIELTLGRGDVGGEPRVLVLAGGRRGVLTAGSDAELHGELLALLE